MFAAATLSSLSICLLGNPILRTKATPVEIFDDKRDALYKKMIDTMHNLKGLGIAAQQVGWGEYVFIVDLADVSRIRPDLAKSCIFDGQETPVAHIMPLVCINSEVTWKSTKKVDSGEGCLSVPGIQGVVKRFEEIEIRFQDPNEKWHTLRCKGLFSFCVQHEKDHLDGILFIDYFRESVKASLNERFLLIEKKGKEQKIAPLL